MPNFFAYLVLFSWPLIAIILFRRAPLVQAIVVTIVAGYLLLPSGTGLDLPMVPTIDKNAIVAISAALGVLMVGSSKTPIYGLMRQSVTIARGRRSILEEDLLRVSYSGIRTPGTFAIKALLAFLFILPFFVFLANTEPVIVGLRFIRGMASHDALSLVGGTLILILPFILGQRYLNTEEAHLILLRILCVALLCYSLPMLWEVRMSPQLHIQIYGFFPHAFDQQVRGDGFRPVVFLNHGLIVAIFTAMACLAAFVLWRSVPGQRSRAARWLLAGVWLAMVLVLCKSFGSLVIAFVLVPVALFGGVRGQMFVAAAIAVIVLSYPMLRGAGLVPVYQVHAWVQSIDADRARSFEVRLENEDALLARANQKPLTGWGTWGRNRVYDEKTGADYTITDGVWAIIIGSTGWFGYIAQFGLLTLPTIILCARRRALNVSLATSGLALVMAANLIDLLPNSSLTPLTWLIGGALAGRCGLVRSTNASANGRTLPRVSSRLVHGGDHTRPARASVSAELAASLSRSPRITSRHILKDGR